MSNRPRKPRPSRLMKGRPLAQARAGSPEDVARHIDEMMRRDCTWLRYLIDTYQGVAHSAFRSAYVQASTRNGSPADPSPISPGPVAISPGDAVTPGSGA